MRVTNQKEFIDMANEIHGYKYDYSLVEYRKSSEKVKIICPIHGEFEQTPNKHLSGQGCKQCGRNRTKLGRDTFVDRARAIHGNKYDYSKVDYKRSDEKVEIICPVHGSFFQTPHSHIILKQNCPKCASWTHGRHWFDATNPFDIDKLNMWKDKAREKGSHYYHNAIDVWTRRDLVKLQTAIDNNLNYLVFWNNDLSDARDWLQSQHLL